jgi:hypothetical protein
MILKIKETNHHDLEDKDMGLLENDKTTSFHMFDGIRHLKRASGNGIRCAKSKKELTEYLKQHKIDYAIINFEPDCFKAAISVNQEYYFYHISIEREPGNWTEIMFAEQAYICNDNGKTLEKLDAGN